MKIKCIHCGEYFVPDEETLQLMTDGYISSSDVNTCDECWEILNHPPDDIMDMFCDADSGL